MAGVVPDDLTSIPQPALLSLCEQLEANPADLGVYGARGQTRTGQFAATRAHADFRSCDAAESAALEAWLTVRAMEHERPKALFTLAAEHLHVRQIVRPSVDQLVRLIGAARERAHQATFDALSAQLTDRARRARLDGLLERRADGTTWIEWLRTPAPDASPRYLLQQLEKFVYLKELGAEELDLSMLPRGRVRMLAGEGRRRPAWELTRLAASRRLAVLLAFCAQTLVARGDELIDLYAAGVQNAERHARAAVAKQREQTAKARDDHAWLGKTLARILVDALESGENPVARAVREVGAARLRAAAQDPGRLTRRVEEERRDALAARHAHLAQFAPRVPAWTSKRRLAISRCFMPSAMSRPTVGARCFPTRRLRSSRRPTGLGSSTSRAVSCVPAMRSRCGSPPVTRCVPAGCIGRAATVTVTPPPG